MELFNRHKIDLDPKTIPELTSFDAGLLWEPPANASTEEWHVAVRAYLDEAEEFYEEQFDHVVDKLIDARRHNRLLTNWNNILGCVMSAVIILAVAASFLI